jgi:hypothetical protein
MPVALVRAVITNDRFGLASLMDNEVEAQLARSRETPFSNLAAQFAPIKVAHADNRLENMAHDPGMSLLYHLESLQSQVYQAAS